MKWNPKIKNHYKGLIQTSVEGSTKAFAYYYIRKQGGYYLNYVVGRYTFGKEIDYHETFSTLKEARAYCEQIDNETQIITAVV